MRSKGLIIVGIIAVGVTIAGAYSSSYQQKRLSKQLAEIESDKAAKALQDFKFYQQQAALNRAEYERRVQAWQAIVAAENEKERASKAEADALLKRYLEDKERTRQQRQHDDMIAEMRRANDIAESAARDQRLRDLTPQPVVIDWEARRQNEQALDEMRRMREIEERREFKENQDRILSGPHTVTTRYHSGQ